MKSLFADRLTCALNLTLVEGEVGEGQRIPAPSINKQGRCHVIFSNVFLSFIIVVLLESSEQMFMRQRNAGV